ncbi:START domain-containing protein [Dyadobacter fermentans]|uniref:Lipid-binding START domain protein n=1 Tax=Dyadobacter fermentans (strain ATCC 700827 / DSM 18053 / CIP 107007 / KCTC 52180 / NS114) TaxID=471854 RepID=C6W0B7_DYAFD|nr:START domain-containing protein [Dyadobacter fermentans]ACT91851.1 lipid-binding START domain protein [Dyadobacter fermentans DSM 18053]
MPKFTLLFIFALITAPVIAQHKWKLIADEEQIRIYSSAVPDSKIKAIKVDCVVDASLAQMAALVMDVEAGTQWVYKTKSCTLVKKLSPNDLYYHSEISLPWPLDNRDFVAHLVAKQNPLTGVVTIDGPVVAGIVPVKKNVVRVKDSKGRWVLTPVQGKVRIEYTLHTDPGGYVPAWAVNAFAAEGPMETFKSMKQQLKLPKYTNASLTFIAN